MKVQWQVMGRHGPRAKAKPHAISGRAMATHLARKDSPATLRALRGLVMWPHGPGRGYRRFI